MSSPLLIDGSWGAIHEDNCHQRPSDGVWLTVVGDHPVWRSEDGRITRIVEMETRHIENCVRFIAYKMLTTGSPWRSGYLEIFKAELAKRDVKPV